MRRATITLVFASVAVITVLVVLGVGTPRPPTRHLIEIRDFVFIPEHLVVSPGDTIVWINRDIVPHTATDTAGGWDSGLLESGASWSWVPGSAGVWSYLCSYHPTMRGGITARSGE